MVKINSQVIFEILFLSRHPKGPKLKADEIAKYVKISEKAVNICLKKFETSDIFQIIEDNNADATDLEHTIDLMEDELKSISLCTWPSTSTLNMSMSSEAEDKPRSDMLSINYTKWIKVCKNDWYDKLEKMLSITKSSVTIKDSIDRLYSVDNFSDQRYDIMMKAIDREVRFKNKVEPLKFYVSNTNHSYYAVKVSMENFKILMEEILEDPLTMDNADPAVDRLVWITKLKWISICKNEWYEKMEKVLTITKAGLQALDSLVNQLYSVDVFTDEKHEVMMKAVDRELKFKERVKVLKVYSSNSYSNDSYYSPTVSVKNFELVLEDILDAAMNKNA